MKEIEPMIMLYSPKFLLHLCSSQLKQNISLLFLWTNKKLHYLSVKLFILQAIVAIPSLLSSATAQNQRPSAGTWLSVHLPLQLNARWQIQNDLNYRTLGNTTAALQHLHRFGLRYFINDKWSVTAGAAFSFTRTSFTKQNKEFAKEFRYWQELNYKTNLNPKLQLQIRTRAEERSFSATSSKAAFHALRYRIKPQLLQKFSAKWALLIADEYMQQHAHNSWSFDQNRLIANGVYYFNKSTQLQAGYMWLRLPANTSQHILTLTYYKTISLHAKQ
ncbi:DUF2490 domain-containing protein [Ferruginibacter sp. SUN106]|uniref:DUF2490 domain-containing protein n=1 Tax=Ferruginibacter sp. SUN106 TaxID=2978348 RepID=UPI003D363091